MTQIVKVEKIWGDEQWIANYNYCGKILRIKQYHRCSFHSHKIKTETFLIISGSIFLELNGKKYILEEGDAIDIFAGNLHRFTAISNCVLVEFSSHHEESDSYRSELSREMNKEETDTFVAELWKLSETNQLCSDELKKIDLRGLS